MTAVYAQLAAGLKLVQFQSTPLSGEAIDRRLHKVSLPSTGGASGEQIKTTNGTSIYYKDWDKGQPVVFSHCWPLNADAWDSQMFFLGQHGYRVIRARSSESRARRTDLGW